MMKRILLGSVAALALGSAAVAADLPTKAPIYQSPPTGFNWSGVYIGGEAGYGFSAIQLGAVGSTASTITDPGSLGTNAAGGVGGLTLAWRYQPLGSGWVFGIKGAGDLTGINSNGNSDAVASLLSTVATGVSIPQSTVSLPWTARVGGELGYSIMPNFLLFVDGGAAFGEIKINSSAVSGAAVTLTNPTGIIQANTDNVHTGWWGGVGGKYALTPNLIFGVEWFYTDLGTQGVTFAGPNLPTNTTFNVSDHAAFNTVLGTLELKF